MAGQMMLLYNIEWLDESFPDISSTLLFRLLLKPCSFVVGQILDPTIDCCQLLLYTRYKFINREKYLRLKSFGGFTLDISSALEVCLKCT